jgi:hypothetical protein
MRKTILVIAVLGLAWIAYVAWPVYAMLQLARAIEARDVATAMTRIDVPSVRQSLIGQITETSMKLTGQKVSPIVRGIVGGVADSIADQIIAKLVTPEAMTELLRTGWPVDALPDRPAGTVGISSKQLGTAWQVFSEARYGIRRFEIFVPPSSPYDRRFGLELRLKQWRWQLVSVTLPEHLRVRLAEAIIKSKR